MEDNDINKYDLGKYISPIWKGKICYAEAVFVREDSSKKILPISLLYKIEKIISVRSSDLETLYVEGKDYRIDTNGKLEILKSGNIPVLSYDLYYHTEYRNDGIKTQIPALDGKGAYLVAETTNADAGMSGWCLAVTYIHKEKAIISEPDDKSGKFLKLNKKLKEGKNVKVIFYGDSITYGWGSTALKEVNIKPFSPKYCDMAMDYLEKKYSVKILRKNFSVSGKTSDWGKEKENCEKITKESPDFTIIAFGVNDGVWMSPDIFVSNIEKIVKYIKSRSPQMEILIVIGFLPNDLVGYTPNTKLRNFQPQYASALKRSGIENKLDVAIADVSAMHTQILKIKRFQDTTSSNTNHPNDYMHRIYAQVVLRALLGVNFY